MNLKKVLFPNILIFTIIGHWPIGNIIIYRIYTFFMMLNVFLYNFTQAIHVGQYIENFLEISQIIHILTSTIAAMLKITILSLNIKLIKEVVSYLDRPEFQPKNKTEESILKKAESVCKTTFYTFGVNCLFVVTMFPMVPVLEGSRRLPIDAWFPYDYLLPGYYVVTYLWQSIFFVYIGCITVSTDTFFAMLLIQIGAQCDVLSQRILNLVTDHRSSNEEELNRTLIMCINEHKLILEWSDKFSKSFANIILVQFMTSTFVLCETLFLLTLSDSFDASAANIVIYQSALLIQLFLYCWYGNELTYKSDRFSSLLFQSNWLKCPSAYKKNMIFFMHRLQKPIIFYVGKIFPASVTTFLTILRSSWAYFTTLRNMRIN